MTDEPIQIRIGRAGPHQRYQAAPDELRGRVIAITGAGDGIGRAVALAAAAHGAELVLIGRTVRKLEAVHAQIAALRSAPKPASRRWIWSSAIARDYDQLADALQRRYGRLDGLVHNAGILGTLRRSSSTTCRPGAACCMSI